MSVEYEEEKKKPGLWEGFMVEKEGEKVTLQKKPSEMVYGRFSNAGGGPNFAICYEKSSPLTKRRVCNPIKHPKFFFFIENQSIKDMGVNELS